MLRNALAPTHLKRKQRLKRLGVDASRVHHANLLALVDRAVVGVRRRGYGLPKRFVVSGRWFQSRFGKNAPYVPAEFFPDSETIYLNADYPWEKLRRIQSLLYRRGDLSTADPLHILRHEIGHALHYRQQPRLVRKLQGTHPLKNPQDKTKFECIGLSVSRYAAVNPLEFVAEVFAGLMSAKRFNLEVMRWYHKFRGPLPISPIASASRIRA